MKTRARSSASLIEVHVSLSDSRRSRLLKGRVVRVVATTNAGPEVLHSFRDLQQLIGTTRIRNTSHRSREIPRNLRIKRFPPIAVFDDKTGKLIGGLPELGSFRFIEYGHDHEWIEEQLASRSLHPKYIREQYEYYLERYGFYPAMNYLIDLKTRSR